MPQLMFETVALLEGHTSTGTSMPLLRLRAHERDLVDPRSSESESSTHDCDTVGKQLKAAFGNRYSTAWLADNLVCELDTAEMLDGYWLAREPFTRTQALTVFARYLNLSRPRLLSMFAEADNASDAPVVEKAQLQGTLGRAPDAKKRAITIGSNEGAREIDSPQPTVVWRRPRITAPESSPAQSSPRSEIAEGQGTERNIKKARIGY
jgi:hypothetical protein